MAGESTATKSFPGFILPARLRENYYIARCCCSWPLLLLPLVQGASRTPTTTAWDAIEEVFSDGLNLKIGDLLSRPLSPATRPPCARPFMLTRPIHEQTSMFSRAPVCACAPATRAHPLLLARDPARACAPASRAHRLFLARRARTPCRHPPPPSPPVNMPAASARPFMYLNFWPAPVAPGQGLSWS
jgi:hypothetical protein